MIVVTLSSRCVEEVIRSRGREGEYSDFLVHLGEN